VYTGLRIVTVAWKDQNPPSLADRALLVMQTHHAAGMDPGAPAKPALGPKRAGFVFIFIGLNEVFFFNPFFMHGKRLREKQRLLIT
jgi:hypothetical protein